MMRFFFVAAMVFAGSASAADALAQKPKTPISVEATLGTSPSHRSKIIVTLTVQITKDAITQNISIQETGMNAGNTIVMPLADAQTVATALVASAGDAGNNKESNLEDKIIRARSTKFGDAFVVAVDRRANSIIRSPIYLDPDNAMAIAVILQNAPKIASWIAPFTRSIQDGLNKAE